MNKNLIILFLLPVFVFFSCHEEDNNINSITGFWQQEKVTEDGIEINFPVEHKNIGLLFESNGIYRTYAKDMPANKEHFGAWSITDNQWLEMTADTWRLNSDPLTQNPANQWVKNHIPVRFSILKLSGNELEIRVKIFVGEQKYAALFTENNRPPVTSENLEAIQQEFRTQKTYIYTFKNVNN